MALDATFNNISVILWRSVLLEEETGENHRLTNYIITCCIECTSSERVSEWVIVVNAKGTGVPRENHIPAENLSQTSHNVWSTPRHERGVGNPGNVLGQSPIYDELSRLRAYHPPTSIHTTTHMYVLQCRVLRY
jgi:hypothetical protein